jgi:hypothetical protein
VTVSGWKDEQPLAKSQTPKVRRKASAFHNSSMVQNVFNASGKAFLKSSQILWAGAKISIVASRAAFLKFGSQIKVPDY